MHKRANETRDTRLTRKFLLCKCFLKAYTSIITTKTITCFLSHLITLLDKKTYLQILSAMKNTPSPHLRSNLLRRPLRHDICWRIISLLRPLNPRWRSVCAHFYALNHVKTVPTNNKRSDSLLVCALQRARNKYYTHCKQTPLPLVGHSKPQNKLNLTFRDSFSLFLGGLRYGKGLSPLGPGLSALCMQQSCAANPMH